MSWALLGLLVAALTAAVLALWSRRGDLAATERVLTERRLAKETGSHRARLQYPEIDLSRCIGCGTCVKACPEDGVLELVHGQAAVVHGARCVGHGRCAAECPVGAIALTLGDISERRDIPVLSETLESPHTPGLFLAGEVTGYALVRTAITHGVAVADEVSRRTLANVAARKRTRSGGGVAVAEADAFDLVIVGAGPAGIACSLRAKELGLTFVTLEQDEIGGTVAKYPRRKLVMTQPVDLPLYGRLKRTSYSKEELVELWHEVVRTHQLPLRTGQEFVAVERGEDDLLMVRTKTSTVPTRNVCLALGRRGTPRKLGVPGEELPKVAYSLLDAHSYNDRRILVVGGGDSAIEAALGLAEQPGNRVSISYRKQAFFRLKSRNDARLRAAIEAGELEVHFETGVEHIAEDHVRLKHESGNTLDVPNDEVFVFAGGTPPFEVLEKSGVSFDGTERRPAPPFAERGTGLLGALTVALVCVLAAAGWIALHADYYRASASVRTTHPDHALLRPTGTIGLWLGVAAGVLVFVNLFYLARRSGRFAWIRGTLQHWMTSHVATGILALLFAIVHSAMDPRHTVGGHALAALGILIVTGAIGRYFYSYVPRAANGRELALDEVHTRLAAIISEWDRGSGTFGTSVRNEVQRFVSESHWHGSFFARVRSLITSERRLRKTLTALRVQGHTEGVARDHVNALLKLARQAQRTALMAAHYEDLRALMASWRYFHRWVALGMVLLVVLHVVSALRYGQLFE
ncbi:MAG: NAD(P)-binding domain-containing protein [Planctomycetes bacterium]|nr:NAD(P)-binding domain-containing protein [Planctomycetota bacterium]